MCAIVPIHFILGSHIGETWWAQLLVSHSKLPVPLALTIFPLSLLEQSLTYRCGNSFVDASFEISKQFLIIFNIEQFSLQMCRLKIDGAIIRHPSTDEILYNFTQFDGGGTGFQTKHADIQGCDSFRPKLSPLSKQFQEVKYYVIGCR